MSEIRLCYRAPLFITEMSAGFIISIFIIAIVINSSHTYKVGRYVKGVVEVNIETGTECRGEITKRAGQSWGSCREYK